MDWDFKVARMSNGRENCCCQLQSQLKTIILKVHLRVNTCFFRDQQYFLLNIVDQNVNFNSLL